MSVAPLQSRRSRRQSFRADRPTTRLLVVSAVLLDLLFLVGAVSAWPIYRTPAFVLVIAVALASAHVLAWAGVRWRLSGWWLSLLTFGVYVVLGLPTVAPTMMTGGGDQLLRGFLGVVTAPVTGWKDLLTLDLPLGTYQTTLAPVFLVWIAVPTAALSLAWRARRLWVLAPILGLFLPVFGVLFGAPTLSDPLRWGGLVVPGPVEMAVGATAVLLALAYVVWRTLDDRRRALRAAEAATGIRTTSRSGSATAGRAAISAAMVAIALVAGAIAAPLAVAGQPRDVLRERIDPRLEIEAQLSPLAQYRSYFADDRFDEVLFAVSADVDRVRLATLSYYDGRLARVIDPATGSDQATAFVRVPSSLPAPAGTRATAAEVTVLDYSDVWLPTVGSLTGVQFRGAGAAGLSDGFFYSPGAQTGVVLGSTPLGPGVSYRQAAAVETAEPAVSDLVPGRSAPHLPAELVPESLIDWMRAQEAPAGGEGLAFLIERLRARGYLSHALTIDPQIPPLWRAELGGAGFEPSRAGHSTDRIDAMFTALLQRQADVGGDDDALLVAAVGDDEQFSVAALMIADQLGFASRIVLGARLTGDQLPACEDGACRGGDLSAWLEVQDASGVWVPVDVTPQHENGMSPDDLQVRDPEVPTEVHQQNAEQVLPGDADPADSGERPDDPVVDSIDWSAVWAAARIGGIVLSALLIVTGPFLLILLVKALRRRARRAAPDATDRMTGGWDEYVDAAIDSGLPGPGTRTRQEVATLHARDDATSRVALLASWADRSVFDAEAPTTSDSDRFWEIVESERARLIAERGWWARLRARLSLRSLVRRGGHGR